MFKANFQINYWGMSTLSNLKDKYYNFITRVKGIRSKQEPTASCNCRFPHLQKWKVILEAGKIANHTENEKSSLKAPSKYAKHIISSYLHPITKIASS